LYDFYRRGVLPRRSKSCGSNAVAASPQDVETDAMLVFAAQDGDADAFSELFRRHYPSIRRACARKLRDLREADEIAQAAFVRAYERLDRCTGDRKFGAWVQVIANNLCVDHMRATARSTPSEDVEFDLDATTGNSPEDALMRSEQAKMVRAALATLPDRQRDVVVARDLEGRRPPEIAAALGLSLGAVDSLLLRARRRLAASVQSLSAESGAANLATTATMTAVTGGATHLGALARVAQTLGDAVASASYHLAASIGMVPGVPSLVAQAAPAAAAGAIALSPLAGAVSHHQVAPTVAPITANIPAAPAPPALGVSAPAVDSPAVTVPAALQDKRAAVQPSVPPVEVPGNRAAHGSLLDAVNDVTGGAVTNIVGKAARSVR
jgi:RNA polymerase sigma-70 factor (ECF subfamily)